MSKLNAELLLNDLKLQKLDTVEAVRRQGQAFALNAAGQIIAVSATQTNLTQLIIDKEGQELKHLYLAGNEQLTELRIDIALPKLQHLYLNNCKLRSLHLPKNMSALKQLYLQKNELETLVFEGDCGALELLDASGNQLLTFTTEPGFPQLAYLYLNNNQIANFELNKPLSALTLLDFRDNQLEELPLGLVQCTKLEAFYIQDNPLNRFNKEVLNDEGDQNSWEGVRNYLSSLVKDDIEEYDQVKLIVLGNSTAGKTSLINFLKDRTYSKGRESTHWMEPILWEIDATCKVAVWDFGGQEYYHNIHHLFFTDKCLYLVIFEQKTNTNGTLPTEIKIFGQDNPIIQHLEHFHYNYWLDNIYYLTQKQNEGKVNLEVIKVQNKFDVPPEQKIEGADHCISVEKAYEALQQQSTQDDLYWLDFRSFEIKLKQKLQQIRGQVPVSAKWLKIKDEIQKTAQAGVPLLTRAQLVALANQIKEGIDAKKAGQEESELDTLLDTFTKSGVVLYYPKIDSERIFINPAWLAAAIYRVLSHQVKENDGKFTLREVEAVLNAWRLEETVSLGEQELIALMRELDLIYELNPELNPEECKNGERIFIAPQYLPLQCREPRNINRFKEICKESGPHFTLKYPIFLPKSTMPRFIARHGHWANHPCWRNGIIYDKQGMEILVECLFDQKLIHFWIKPSEQKNELVREVFNAFHDLNDKNPEVQISRNQVDFVQIGRMLKHPFGANSKIEAVNGTLLEAKDFADFVGYVDHEPRNKFFHQKFNDMYGVEKEIEGYKILLDELIEKKNEIQVEQVNAYDVEKKLSLKKSVRKLEEEINECRQKMVGLENSLGARLEPAQSSQLQELLNKTNALSADLGTIHQKLDQGFLSILSQLSAQDQQLLAIHQATEAHQAALAKFFIDLDQKPVNEYETQILLGQINSMIADHVADLPEAIAQQLKSLNTKAADYTDAKGKLKLKIPLIPSILEYEKELSWDLRKMAEQIWSDLKSGKIFLK